METNLERFSEIFKNIKNIKVGLYGDFCLDSYWILDPRGSEVSLETGLKAQAVAKQKYSLGGASNVAANLAALKPKRIQIFGVYGDDIFGKEMISQLEALRINTSSMVVQKEEFYTYTFSKLILEGKEQPRIDFGTYNKRSYETDRKILDNIKESLSELDIFIINQQVPESITNLLFITEFNKIIKENSNKIFIADSRHFADKFKNVSYKVNIKEAVKISNNKLENTEEINGEVLKNTANELYSKTERPVFITRGDNGILAFSKNEFFEAPGIKLSGQIDIVGAGDTVLSAISCSLAADCSIKEAIELANLAAAVTIQKLFQTGTANENEIIDLFKSLNLN